jgi:hypothetical protein
MKGEIFNMAVSTIHGQLSVVDSGGNVTIVKPQTDASVTIVDVSSNKVLPRNATNVQALANSLNKLAFDSGADMIRINLTQAENLNNY